MNPASAQAIIQEANGPLLILLIGLPGSGKSTWAHRNARDAIVVSQDDLIDAITPLGFDTQHGRFTLQQRKPLPELRCEKDES